MNTIEIFVNDASATKDLAKTLAAGGMADCLRTVDLKNPPASGLPSTVLRTLAEGGAKDLPLTIYDGAIRLKGRLPTSEEVAGMLAGKQEVAFTNIPNYVEDSAVSFPTRSRVHMNLVVKDVAESVRFYEILFGQPPSKNTGDYAKFELADPPIHLALMADPHGGAKNHFGIQVKSSNVIRHAISRYADAGFYLYEEQETACCYAKQTKTWVVDPEGHQWEIFVTTDYDSHEGCEPDCICYQDLKPSVSQA